MVDILHHPGVVHEFIREETPLSIRRKRYCLPGDDRPRQHLIGTPDLFKETPFVSLSKEERQRKTDLFLTDYDLAEAWEEDLKATQRAATAALNEGLIGQYLLLQHSAQENTKKLLNADPDELKNMRRSYFPKSIKSLMAIESAEMRDRRLEAANRHLTEKINTAKEAAERSRLASSSDTIVQIFQRKK